MDENEVTTTTDEGDGEQFVPSDDLVEQHEYAQREGDDADRQAVSDARDAEQDAWESTHGAGTADSFSASPTTTEDNSDDDDDGNDDGNDDGGSVSTGHLVNLGYTTVRWTTNSDGTVSEVSNTGNIDTEERQDEINDLVYGTPTEVAEVVTPEDTAAVTLKRERVKAINDYLFGNGPRPTNEFLGVPDPVVPDPVVPDRVVLDPVVPDPVVPDPVVPEPVIPADTTQTVRVQSPYFDPWGDDTGDETDQAVTTFVDVAPVDTTPVTRTVTVQNPYFDPNFDDTGGAEDQLVTVDVPAPVIPADTTRTVTVQNPYFDPNFDDTGGAEDQLVTVDVPAPVIPMDDVDDGDDGGEEDYIDRGVLPRPPVDTTPVIPVDTVAETQRRASEAAAAREARRVEASEAAAAREARRVEEAAAATETQRQVDEAAAEWARREVERLARIDQNAADAAAAREARRVEEAATAAETQRRANEAAVAAAAEIQRRADEAAAKWAARGTTAGDSTGQDHIDQGIIEVPTSETGLGETVTVANPYFDPNADDMGDGTDLKATVEVAKSSVTSRPSLPTVLVDNPYFDPYGDDTGDGFDQKATDRVSIGSARTEGIDFEDEYFYDAGFQNPLPQAQSEPVQTSTLGNMRDVPEYSEPFNQSWVNSSSSGLWVPTTSDAERSGWTASPAETYDSYLKIEAAAKELGESQDVAIPPVGLPTQEREKLLTQMQLRKEKAEVAFLAAKVEYERNIGLTAKIDAITAAEKQLKESRNDVEARLDMARGGWRGGGDPNNPIKVALEALATAEAGLIDWQTQNGIKQKGLGEEYKDMAIASVPILSTVLAVKGARSSDGLWGGTVTPGEQKTITESAAWDAVALLTLPADVAAGARLLGGGARSAKTAARLGVGSEFSGWTSPNVHVPKVMGTTPEVTKASLKLREDLANTGKAEVIIGDRMVTIDQDLLNKAVREANPEITLTSHATPVADVIAGGPAVRPKPGVPDIEKGFFVSPGTTNRNLGTQSAFGVKGESPGTILFGEPIDNLIVPGQADGLSGVKRFKGGHELEFVIGEGENIPPSRKFSNIGDHGLYLDERLTAPSRISTIKANVESLLFPGSEQRGKIHVGGIPESMTNDDVARVVYGDDAVDMGLTPSQLSYIDEVRSGSPRVVAERQALEDSVSKAAIEDDMARSAQLSERARATVEDVTTSSSARSDEIARAAISDDPRAVIGDDARARARLDNVAAQWEARGTTVGGSGEDDYIERGALGRENPVLDPVIRDPIVDPVIRDPIVDPVIRDPIVDPVIRDPIVDPVIRDPIVDPVIRDPIVDPVIRDPIVDPVIRDPIVDPVIRDPIVDPVIRDPIVDPVIRDPIVDPVIRDPIVDPVIRDPIVDPVIRDPIVDPVIRDPIVDPVIRDPIVDPVIRDPIVDPVIRDPIVDPPPEREPPPPPPEREPPPPPPEREPPPPPPEREPPPPPPEREPPPPPPEREPPPPPPEREPPPPPPEREPPPPPPEREPPPPPPEREPPPPPPEREPPPPPPEREPPPPPPPIVEKVPVTVKVPVLPKVPRAQRRPQLDNKDKPVEPQREIPNTGGSYPATVGHKAVVWIETDIDTGKSEARVLESIEQPRVIARQALPSGPGFIQAQNLDVEVGIDGSVDANVVGVSSSQIAKRIKIAEGTDIAPEAFRDTGRPAIPAGADIPMIPVEAQPVSKSRVRPPSNDYLKPKSGKSARNPKSAKSRIPGEIKRFARRAKRGA